MKQKFCDELRQYNKVHRLIGNVSCETLVRQSIDAFTNTGSELDAYLTMIDVGAGSGILGYAWLLGSPERRCIFVEPDGKAVSFLHSYFGGESRARVIGRKLEDVRLAEISDFIVDSSKVLLATRAFSSFRTLEECYQLSQLPYPLYTFDEEDKQFFMRRVEV